MIQPTYAQMAQVKKDVVQTIIQKIKNAPRTTLFVTSKSGEDGKKVRETFTQIINPVKEKIKVRAMRTAGKMLIVETNSEEDAQKIMSNKNLGTSLKCEPPKRRKPLMIVYDVPVEIKEEEVLESVY